MIAGRDADRVARDRIEPACSSAVVVIDADHLVVDSADPVVESADPVIESADPVMRFSVPVDALSALLREFSHGERAVLTLVYMTYLSRTEAWPRPGSCDSRPALRHFARLQLPA